MRSIIVGEMLLSWREPSRAAGQRHAIDHHLHAAATHGHAVVAGGAAGRCQ